MAIPSKQLKISLCIRDQGADHTLLRREFGRGCLDGSSGGRARSGGTSLGLGAVLNLDSSVANWRASVVVDDEGIARADGWQRNSSTIEHVSTIAMTKVSKLNRDRQTRIDIPDTLGVGVVLEKVLEFVAHRGSTSANDGLETLNGLRREASIADGLLATELELLSTELTSSSSLLLQQLLLMSVREADLDDVVISIGLLDDGVVERLDDVITNITRLESREQSQ